MTTTREAETRAASDSASESEVISTIGGGETAVLPVAGSPDFSGVSRESARGSDVEDVEDETE